MKHDFRLLKIDDSIGFYHIWYCKNCGYKMHAILLDETAEDIEKSIPTESYKDCGLVLISKLLSS